MSMLDIHKQSLESGTIAYHEFLGSYKKGDSIIYGIVEGKEDVSFYRSLILNEIPSNWRFKIIISGNKKRVLNSYRLFDWCSFKKEMVCFFVDRDLSDFLNENHPLESNVYVTEKYSIENELATSDVFERVLEEVYSIDGLTPVEVDNILNIFHQNMSFFCDALSLVMSQIILWKRDGGKPCLDNIDLKNIFYFEDGCLHLKDDAASPIDRINLASIACKLPAHDYSILEKMEKDFREKNGHYNFIRGKYIIWLFIHNLESIHKSINKFSGKHTAPPKIHVSICQANFITIIGPRARIPDCLKRFVQDNYIKYILSLILTENT